MKLLVLFFVGDGFGFIARESFVFIAYILYVHAVAISRSGGEGGPNIQRLRSASDMLDLRRPATPMPA